MSLSFERPLLFLLTLFALVVAYVVSRILRTATAIEIPLGPPGGSSFEPPVGADLAVRVLHAAELIGALCLAIAAGGPISLTTETVWLERGADILFIVDASPSMSARDMGASSRFDAARRLVREFSLNRGADAIGLVAVGGDAALLVPPTVDRRALLARLESLSIAELGDGTALGLGLSVAALHLSSSRAPRKAAVLITDGENNAGAVHPATAAAALRAAGASLWVVGVGGSGEVAVDYVDPTTKQRRTGVFDSRFDPEALRSIARSGGGTYLSAPSADAFARAFSRLDVAEATAARSRSRIRTAALHMPFVVVGIVLLVSARAVRRLVLGAFL
jgi:Ca-activated chloride channel family protein